MKAKLTSRLLNGRYVPILIGLLMTIQINLHGQTVPSRVPNPTDHEYCSRVTHEHNGVIPISNNNFIKKSSTAKIMATCTNESNADWAGLSTSGLVAALKSQTEYDCYRAMFSFQSGYTPYIFSNEKVTAVANEMYYNASNYNGTYSSGFYGMAIYIHIAVYHNFYQSTVTLNDATWTAIRRAYNALSTNSNMLSINAEGLSILKEILITCGEPEVRKEASVVNFLEDVIQNITVTQPWKTIADEKLKSNYSDAVNSMYDAFYRGYSDSNLHTNILNTNIVNLLGQTATNQALIDEGGDLVYLWQNASGALALLAQGAPLISSIEPELAKIINFHPRMSPSWVKAMEALNKYGDCTPYNLCMHPDALRSELQDLLFPKQFTYDDGKMVVKTPISDEKVQNLYHAAKQVQNQFFRLLQTDEPVTGDTNETINMIVFGSKQEYIDYAPILYNIATDNGGMYIEGISTFYTWDRTVGVESSLSLESLFRHEYCHYLQGRYLVPGLWGQSTIYENSRLVWYEEGMADFFAGSTDIEGSKLLAQNSSAITSAAEWPTLNTVFNSSYTSGNFFHYTYGNAAWYNWYLNDFSKLKQFFDLTRNNDVTGFDNLVNNLRSTGQTSYNTFLNNVKNGSIEGWQPETPWSDDNYISIGDPADIKTEFASITGRNDVTAGIEVTDSYRRFKITGSISGTQYTNNNTDAAQQIHTALNAMLVDLRGNELVNNFQYTVAYFKNLNYSGSVPTADFVLTGPLKDAVLSDAPQANFSAADLTTVVGGSVAFTSETTGYIQGLSWNFTGGSPAQVLNKQQPLVQYNTEGTFNASLTATGKNSTSSSKTKNNLIRVFAKGPSNYCAADNTGSGSNFLTRVQFGTLDNETGSEGGYNDFTSRVAIVKPGSTNKLTLSTIFDSWSYNAPSVWIDWNQDGDFEDANEAVYSKYGPGPFETNVTVPANALMGTTRMRVRMSYGAESYIAACGTQNSTGEIEDYSLVITNESGPANQAPSLTIIKPTNGATFVQKENLVIETLVEDDAGVEKAELYIDGSLFATDTEAPFQWGNSNALNLLDPGTRNLSVTAYDAAGLSATQSVSINIEKAPLVWCDASGTSDSQHITKVAFGSINNSTGFGGGYSDFTNQNTVLDASGATLTINIINEHWTYNAIGAWIDWNQDGDFIDNGEEVYRQYGAGPFTTSIVSPSGALTGVPLRMRVRMAYGSENYITSCGTISGSGEVEDYTVFVNGTGNTDLEPPTAPSNLTASNIGQTSVDLNWVGSTDNVGVKEYRVLNGTAVLTTNTSTSTTINNLTEDTAYNLSVIAVDSAGNKSTASNSVVVTTLPPTPTCSDGVQNGDEEGIDCGGTSCVPCATVSYCTASTAGNTNYISNVTFGDINNNSTHQSYSNYTNVSANVNKGDVVALSVGTNLDSWTYNAVGVWIDWNRDGDFTGAGEEVLHRYAAGPYSANVTVPTGAVTGAGLRMRVRLGYGAESKITPCGTDTYFGEVEDYTIFVGGQGNGDTQAPTSPTSLQSSAVSSTTANLSWVASSDNVAVTGYSIAVNGSQVGTTTSTNYALNNLTAATNITVSVTANDAAGNVSSGAQIAITTLAYCADGIQNNGETGVDCGGTCTPCSGGNAGVVYVDITDEVTNSSNTWNFFRIDIGDDNSYGGWYTGGTLKLETYNKDMVAEGQTSNLTLLGNNVEVGANSNFVDGFNQYTVASSSYTASNGKEGYLGFKVNVGNDVHYGWFHIQVASNGAQYTILDYAYQSTANTSLNTGNNATGAAGVELGGLGAAGVLSVYPNPSENEFQVALEGDRAFELLVYDVRGKLMEQRHYLKGTRTLTFGADLPSGNQYILKLRWQDQEYNQLIFKK